MEELKKKIREHEEAVRDEFKAVVANENNVPDPEDGEPEEPEDRFTKGFFSAATRGCRVQTDKTRLRKYDVHAAEARRMRRTCIVILLLLGGGAGAFFATGHWVWGAVFSLGALFFGFRSLMFQIAATLNPYESGMLVPAIVTDPGNCEIVVLANILAEESNDIPAQWACRRMRLPELVLHKAVVGERVPCAAMFGGLDAASGRWTCFNPYPLVWATDDMDVIRCEGEQIPEAEWQLLYRYAAVVHAMQPELPEEELALFGEDGQVAEIVR